MPRMHEYYIHLFVALLCKIQIKKYDLVLLTADILLENLLFQVLIQPAHNHCRDYALYNSDGNLLLPKI